MNTLTNKAAIETVVKQAPGHTAHWYSRNFGTPIRMSCLYAAFARAVKAGIVRSQYDVNKKQTLYFPYSD